MQGKYRLCPEGQEVDRLTGGANAILLVSIPLNLYDRLLSYSFKHDRSQDQPLPKAAMAN